MNNEKTTPLTGAFYLGEERLDTSNPETLEYVRSRFAAKPAQPVEAVGAFTPIPEAVEAPTPELWRAYEAFNDVYRGGNTQQALRAAINGVLAERAALAHPRPMGAVALISVVANGDPVLQPVEGWDRLSLGNHLLYAAPTVEQAGEVVRVDSVAYRYRKRGCGGTWRYGSVSHRNTGRGPDPKVFEVEMLARTEDAQPRPVGVPDGDKPHG